MLCLAWGKDCMKQPLCLYTLYWENDPSTKNLSINYLSAMKEILSHIISTHIIMLYSTILLPCSHIYKNPPASSFSYPPPTSCHIHLDLWWTPGNLQSCFPTYPCFGIESLFLIWPEGLSSPYPIPEVVQHCTALIFNFITFIHPALGTSACWVPAAINW